ncbi:MAG: TIGR02147 family protein, partial [Proteobacteria bacterium]|nr:TIGR02147 family protein [Pseudomonadota bacterium]
EAIRNLYLSFKERNQRYSIPYICKKAGISSQGYLSDVIHGKRTLHLKYKVGILRALELKGAAARCLKTLIEIDHQKDPVLAAKLERRLLVQKKALTIEHRSISHDMAQFFLALEVFCAFGLFNNKPTLQNLVNYFASQSAGDLHRAVLLLKELKLIEMDREHYVVSTGQVNFSGERFSQIDYLKLAFKQGIQSIDKWYAYPDYALFESINMSVKKSELLKYLPTVRQNTEDLRLGLETEDGDMVVRLNLQIYPVE